MTTFSIFDVLISPSTVAEHRPTPTLPHRSALRVKHAVMFSIRKMYVRVRKSEQRRRVPIRRLMGRKFETVNPQPLSTRIALSRSDWCLFPNILILYKQKWWSYFSPICWLTSEKNSLKWCHGVLLLLHASQLMTSNRFRYIRMILSW